MLEIRYWIMDALSKIDSRVFLSGFSLQNPCFVNSPENHQSLTFKAASINNLSTFEGLELKSNNNNLSFIIYNFFVNFVSSRLSGK